MITTQYLHQSIEKGDDVAALGWLASAHEQTKVLPLTLLSLAVRLGRAVVVVEWARLFPSQVTELDLADLVAAPSAEVVFGLLQAPIDIEQKVSLHEHSIPLSMAWGLKFPILLGVLEQRRLGDQARIAAKVRYEAIVAQMTALNNTPIQIFSGTVLAPNPSLPKEPQCLPAANPETFQSSQVIDLNQSAEDVADKNAAAKNNDILPGSDLVKSAEVVPITSNKGSNKGMPPMFPAIDVHDNFIDAMQKDIR